MRTEERNRFVRSRQYGLMIRRIPKTHWVKVGISLTGRLQADWTPKPMYRGVVTRMAWPVRGRGLYVLICWKGMCRPKTAKWIGNEARPQQ